MLATRNLWGEMQSKISPEIIFLVLIILSLVIYLSVHGLYMKSNSLLVTSTQDTTCSETGSARVPIRLKIPKINVDTTIVPVGLTAQGAMGTPKGPAEAAWFNLGPFPGENGTAVIDGHFGWEKGIPAVFDNLYTLQKGDKIYIQNETGATITFVVQELRVFGQHEDTSTVFVSSDGKAHLNLITCEGTWNEQTQSYSNRLVVFAEKETASK